MKAFMPSLPNVQEKKGLYRILEWILSYRSSELTGEFRRLRNMQLCESIYNIQFHRFQFIARMFGEERHLFYLQY